MKLADQARLRQWMAQVCVIGMICLSITAPPIVISGSLPFFKAEQLLIPIVLAGYVWLLLAGIARPIRFNGMFVAGSLALISNIVSITYGASLLGHRVVISDYYELPKVWLPVAFFTIAYEAELSEAALRRLVTWFSFAALLVCFYAWGQFIGLGFTYKLNPYYATGHHDLALEYARRVYATAGNANILGAMMSWCVVLYVLATVYRVGNRLLNILAAFACVITAVMTGSRYSIITITLGILLIFALAWSTSRQSLRRLAVVVVMVPLLVWTFQTVATSNRRTLERFETLKDPLRVDSLRERLDVLWPIAWADLSSSPLVGHGPGKSFLQYYVGARLEGYIDSEYLGALRAGGIIGFIVFLSYYCFPLYLIWKGQRATRFIGSPLAERAPAMLMTLQAGLIMGVLALVMNIGMATYSTPFLQGFLWMWLGIGARSAANSRGLLQVQRAGIANELLLEPQNVSSV